MRVSASPSGRPRSDTFGSASNDVATPLLSRPEMVMVAPLRSAPMRTDSHTPSSCNPPSMKKRTEPPTFARLRSTSHPDESSVMRAGVPAVLLASGLVPVALLATAVRQSVKVNGVPGCSMEIELVTAARNSIPVGASP